MYTIIIIYSIFEKNGPNNALTVLSSNKGWEQFKRNTPTILFSNDLRIYSNPKLFKIVENILPVNKKTEENYFKDKRNLGRNSLDLKKYKI